MNIDFNNIQGFAFKKGAISTGEELNAFILSGYNIRGFDSPDEVPDNWIPAGTVEWCNLFLSSKQSKPKYFPIFTNDYLNRFVWICNNKKYFNIVTNKYNFKKVFVKPNDIYKRFNGHQMIVTDKLPSGLLMCSEVVNFVNEWRYYISNGKVVTSGWYAGDEENTPDPPSLDIKIPSNYNGTLDFGILRNGKFTIVESHKPYACGLYSKDYKEYIQWLINGWKYLMSI